MRFPVCLALVLLAGPVFAAEPAGWAAAPAADATMEKGRRFTCEGPDCPPSGLVCLHAVAPGGPGQGRTLRVHDMLRAKGFPWADFEGWVKSKVAEMRPEAGLAAGEFAASEPARLERIGERDFMRRAYEARAATTRDAVEVGLWVTDNRLNTAVCALPAVDRPLAAARITGFFGAMNASPPAPPYDPLAEP